MKKKVVRKKGTNKVARRSTSTPPGSSDVASRILPVEDLSTGLTMAVYGKQGSGKTTLFGSFPTPSLLVDVRDHGARSVMDVKGLKKYSVASWQDFEDLYWYLEENPKLFRSVAIDTTTQLQAMAYEKSRIESKKPPGFTSKRLFGQTAGLMNTWILNFRDLNVHGINVCFIAQERVSRTDDEDDSDSQLAPSVGPANMPSIASVLNGAVDVIGNCFIREEVTREPGKKPKRVTQYAMRVGPHEYYITKIRSPKSVKTPAIIIDPTFDKVVSAIRGK